MKIAMRTDYRQLVSSATDLLPELIILALVQFKATISANFSALFMKSTLLRTCLMIINNVSGRTQLHNLCLIMKGPNMYLTTPSAVPAITTKAKPGYSDGLTPRQ